MAVATAAALAVALAAAASPARAQDRGSSSPDLFEKPDEPGPTAGRKYYSVGVLGGPWYGLLRGTLRYPVTFDLPGGLALPGKFSADVKDDEILPFGDFFATFKYVAIYGDFWYGRFSDETTVDANFTFAGQAFSAAAPVRAALKTITAGGRIQLNPLSIDFVELGVSLGARYVNAEGALSGQDPRTGFRVEETRRVETALPQVGLSLTFFLGRSIDVYARARGFAITYRDFAITHVEGEAGVAFNIGDHVSIGAEYRIFFAEIDDRRKDVADQDRANLDSLLQGPAVYLRLRF
jgi:opacity protein-like surface antigen